MSDCCDTSPVACTSPRKRCCPTNQTECPEVGVATILHHLKAPWAHPLTAQKYYFCASEDCDVVYFGEDMSVIKRQALRDTVGQKQHGADKVLCYCFGVTLGDAQRDPAIKAFVTQQTKQGACACEARNPSGRCCLKDFPK